MGYVISPPPVPSLRVVGSDDEFPVRRIYCIGRNYAEHAIEMGHDPTKEPPFFFQKNPDNLLPEGQDFPYPPKTEDVHFEIELVVALKSGGTNIPVENAMDHVFGYAVGLDMTRRDLQGEAKKLGRPWEIGKAFEHSAPCGPIVPAEKTGHLTEGSVTLEVNGQLKQKGDLNQMIWKIPEMISYLSDYFRLAPGDLIMSGTPAGVGAVKRGDTLLGKVEGVGELKVKVA
ncbi:fumarylacetoacetate hydrolase family protein [Microvirga massiliensis]|uniref:fumarylacetoacetate hydrolase family protein n=1 Tax=Microvirga massiliensis TaxID=1033741 RepID=UPI00062BD147|nr:fumarylacetoacetate hydrolase family protein [Microvirga massiliensis]